MCRKSPTTLAELMKRAKKYIRQDDALITSRFVREARDRRKAVEDKRLNRQEKRHNRGLEALNRHQWKRKQQRPYQPRFLR